MSKAEIIPAILTSESSKFKEIVRKLEPYTKRIHVDIADGEFVPGKTISAYDEIKELDAQVKYDIHLMVKTPSLLLKEWLYTHADRFILHTEAEGDLGGIANELHKNGRKVGLALNPETPADRLDPYLGSLDFIQFMTVHPGKQGGKFAPEVVDKISAFHAKYPDIILMADGGITPETAPVLIDAGASELVSGSYVVKSQDFEKAIQQLKEAVNK